MCWMQKKKVNMIFQNTKEIMSVRCGDEENPCALNFTVKKLKSSFTIPTCRCFKKGNETKTFLTL